LGSEVQSTEETVARILVIDDEASMRRMLRQALERVGYEIVEAQDGDEGLQWYHTASIDLIISDILLVGQEGLEAIRTLRREAPEAKIIAMSGGGYVGDSDILAIARQSGAQRTLQKPFDLQELFRAVWEVLQDTV
jgi:CheY-like chemotaxis protein